MLTIAGNGMGDYTFDNLNIDTSKYDKIICDKNFLEYNSNVLKLSYRDAKEYILQNYINENILYVVTGSPLFFSAGILLAKQLPQDMVQIIDNTSSKSYIQSKMLISDNDISVISLHGRDRIDLNNFLTKRYTLILCDKDSIEQIKDATKYIDLSQIKVTMGHKLGYEDEVIEQISISYDSYRAFDLTKPYVIIIERCYTPPKTISEDDDFHTERGMITKRYKRQLSLQNLDLEPNQILWDVGSGSGSCAIEAYKRYRVKTVLFEKQELRNSYIKENLTKHFVCDTILLEGNAQDLFDNVANDPNRIFVGGGGKEVIAKLPYLYKRLQEKGIMLINAITLKNLSQMITVLNGANIVYEVISLSLTTYKGKLDLIEPERQLFQIKIEK